MSKPQNWLTLLPAAGLAAMLVLLPARNADAEATKDVLAAQQRRVEVMAKARAATCCIFASGGRGGGSGVCISPDGYALSNFHVTQGAGEAMQVGMADGVLYDAVIVAIDPVGDVALIKLLGRDDFPHAPLGDSDQVRMGDWVFASGNPFLLANDFTPTVTYGIVSGTHRYQYPAGTLLEYGDCLQVDASINPGNSGGPLFNEDGEVVGINGRGSFEKRGRVNVGVGYAISSNQIKNFLGYLKSGRILDHATVGAQVASTDDGRVTVTNVLESSDAYRRGLRYGDEVLRFGWRSIRSANDFKNVLSIFPKGWRVPMTFRREGKNYDVWVRLAGVHKEQELIKLASGQPEEPRPTPMPGDPPMPPGPGDKPMPPMPMPRPGAPPAPPKAEIPEAAKKLIEARTGFANYHFNRIEQERVWAAAASHGDFTAEKGAWTIEAKGAGDLPAKFVLTDSKITGALPGGEISMDIDQKDPELGAKLQPVGSGGLFAALHLWRRFLVRGLKDFGAVEYVGAVTLPDHEGLVDCLVGTHGGVTCHLLTDPQNGRLLAVEMFPDKESDPCELRFSNYAEKDGRQLPGQIEVRYGNGVYQTYKDVELTTVKS